MFLPTHKGCEGGRDRGLIVCIFSSKSEPKKKHKKKTTHTQLARYKKTTKYVMNTHKLRVNDRSSAQTISGRRSFN